MKQDKLTEQQLKHIDTDCIPLMISSNVEVSGSNFLDFNCVARFNNYSVFNGAVDMVQLNLRDDDLDTQVTLSAASEKKLLAIGGFNRELTSTLEIKNGDIAYTSDIDAAVSSLATKSELSSGLALKADISSVHGDYIQDASGYRINASLSCRTKDLTLPWSLTGNSHSYSLQYDPNSRKWTYVETDAQKIELSYEIINDSDIVLWVLDFYEWDSASSEWRFSSGYTTTAEYYVTELYFNDTMWHASRSTIGDDMLAT